jgi:hypothetical protein
MIIIRQKQFGAVKAANKLAKRAWLEKQGSGGFLGFAKKKGNDAVRAGRDKIAKGIEYQQASFRKGKNGTDYFKSLN